MTSGCLRYTGVGKMSNSKEIVEDSPMAPANAGDQGLIPGLGRSSGGEHGNSLQYSCLENPMDRGASQGAVHRAAQSWTQLK